MLTASAPTTASLATVCPVLPPALLTLYGSGSALALGTEPVDLQPQLDSGVVCGARAEVVGRNRHLGWRG